MGNCPCCPKRDGNYNPYVEDDDDYREYDSPHSHGYKKPLVTSSATNTHTNRYPHDNRPPDQSTYSPPPLPPSRSGTISQDPTQPQQRNTPPTSTTLPQHPSTQSHPQHQQQQQHYTQYSESLYLARQPEQPTDSMLLDSMMKSSFMERRNYPAPPSSSSPFGAESGDFDGGSSLVDSAFGSGSASTATHNPDFGASTQSPDFAASTQSPDFAVSTQNLDPGASLVTSTSSSVYYDAPGASGYMMESINEGAFEPPQQQ